MFIFFGMFRYGYYVLVECVHEHKVCVEDNVKNFLGNYIMLFLTKSQLVPCNVFRFD